jgi:uncharacterized YigZ family protein
LKKVSQVRNLFFGLYILETMVFTYKSILKPATGLFKDKGSKFLAFAYPLKTEEEAKNIVDQFKKEYHDARHHCYAYRLGAPKTNFRANDDGEPSGTAGKPILGQILSNDLTNILIVVVRYFGGTLLGTSGLIQAYKESSADAIKNAAIIDCFVYSNVRVKFDYIQLNAVMKVIKDYEIEPSEQLFDTECNILLKIKKEKEEMVLKKLKSIETLTFDCLGDD